VGRAPVSVLAVLTLWSLGAATASLLSGPAPALRTAAGLGAGSLGAGRWWSLVSGGFWCSGPVGYLATTVLVFVLVAPAEVRIGATRTVSLLVATQVLGGAAGVGLVALGADAGEPWAAALASQLAVGPSTGAVGVALAATVRLGPLWRRRIRVVLLVGLVMLALYSGSLQDVLRLAGGTAGLLLGPAVLGRARRGPTVVMSAPETRTLVALIVAACAIGPMLAVLSGTAIGPLSVLRLVVLAPPPHLVDVQASCADPTSMDDCLSLRYRLRLGGLGPAIMSVLPALLLLVLADGLRRGRRIAWRGALGLNTLFALAGGMLAVVTATSPAERLVAFGGAGDAQFRAGVLASVAQPLAVVALLIATQGRYRIDASPSSYCRWAMVLATTAAATSMVFLVGAHWCRDEFSPAPDWSALLTDLPTRFLPPGYLGELEIAFLPITPVATVLYEWTGVAFWTVVIGASLWVLRRTRVVGDDTALARRLIIDGGGSTMSWLSTWAGNQYWFLHADPGPSGIGAPSRAIDIQTHVRPRAGIAYRVIGGVALTTGEPFGDTDSRAGAIEDFARFCAENAWTPCLYGVGSTVVEHAEALGWDSLQVAEETVVALDGLVFTGKKWQDVRSALNHAAKAEVTAEWISYRQAPLAVLDQIQAISEEWVADKGLPEMGFTLGGLDELADEQVRCLLAVDASHTVHGITSWLPIHEAGHITGWTLDFMRRRNSGFRGAMEFLIASAALRFQDEGARWLSLSGAPLARLERGEQPSGLQNLLDESGRALEPIYGFRSLLAFKAKFQPEYRPLYMAYLDSAALPAIATAIGRAYLPHLGASEALRLLRRLRPGLSGQPALGVGGAGKTAGLDDDQARRGRADLIRPMPAVQTYAGTTPPVTVRPVDGPFGCS
jgi:lysylphosphatidylglycerol synthetase-like protein (DUF2156 family)